MALLLMLQSAPSDILVTAPPKGTPQTPATVVAEPVAMMIAAFDADGDAVVERSELIAGVQHSYEAMKPPADGMRYIAFADWAERWLGDRNALPSPFEVDRNQDDRVTLDELQDQFARLFARYDTNKDHQVTRAELVTYRARPIGDDPRRPGGAQDGNDKRKAPSRGKRPGGKPPGGGADKPDDE